MSLLGLMVVYKLYFENPAVYIKWLAIINVRIVHHIVWLYCRKIENERFLVLEMAFRMNSSFFNGWYASDDFERLFSH
jgi:hypothetical protein